MTCSGLTARSIDWHYDKTPDITPGSIITVIKLGEHARPFGVRHRLFLKPSSTFKWVDPKTADKDTEKEKHQELESQLNKQKAAFAKLQNDNALIIFNEDVEPGTAIFMTVSANECTQHAVLPADAQETGSIVLRSIQTIIPKDDKRIPIGGS